MRRLIEDYPTALSQGNIIGTKVIHKFGSNPDIGTDLEDIWSTGGVYTWLQEAVQLEAISTSTNDTAAGSGARTVFVEGLGPDWKEASAVITMNGTSASAATTHTFIRIHRAYVLSSGTFAATTLTASQAGVITIRTASAGATHVTLALTAGTYMSQTELSRYTIPYGYTGYLHSISATSASNQRCSIYMFQRQNPHFTANFTVKRLVWRVVGISSPILWQPEVPLKFGQMTDLWMSANVALTSTSVESTFELVLTENEVAEQL